MSYASVASSAKSAPKKGPPPQAKRGYSQPQAKQSGYAKKSRGGNLASFGQTSTASQPASFEDIKASHMQQNQKILAMLQQYGEGDDDDDDDLSLEDEIEGGGHSPLHPLPKQTSSKEAYKPRTMLSSFPTSSSSVPKKKRANLLGFGDEEDPVASEKEELQPALPVVEIICQICLTKVCFIVILWFVIVNPI